MFGTHKSRTDPNRARGTVAYPVCFCLVFMLGFAALVIDVGGMYNVRADLQRAADAGALAGASSYTSDDMMRVRMGYDTSASLSTVIAEAVQRVNTFALPNGSLGTSVTHVASDDIVYGALPLNSATAPLNTTPAATAYNGVQVTVRREIGGVGTNPPVEYFFARIFGISQGTTGAFATAVFDDRFSTYTPGTPGTGALPLTINRDAYYSELAAGGDNYGWNPNGGVETGSGDGIREIRLYPYPLSGSGYTEGDGNFGVLNIGTGNQGLQALRNQIINGVTAQDFVDEVGTSDLTFYDDDGDPVTYQISGSPGLDGGLAGDIDAIQGEIVAFFLHTNVILSGSNAEYTIVDVRFGRVMDIKLTGAPSGRGLYIQPVSYSGSDVIIDPNAPSSGGMVGRVVLAR